MGLFIERKRLWTLDLGLRTAEFLFSSFFLYTVHTPMFNYPSPESLPKRTCKLPS